MRVAGSIWRLGGARVGRAVRAVEVAVVDFVGRPVPLPCLAVVGRGVSELDERFDGRGVVSRVVRAVVLLGAGVVGSVKPASRIFTLRN